MSKVIFDDIHRTCELKVCTIMKPENPIDYLVLPAAPELFVLCVIPVSGLKGGKNISVNNA